MRRGLTEVGPPRGREVATGPLRARRNSMAPTSSFRSSVRGAAALSLLACSLGLGAEARAEPSKKPPELGWNYNEMETARTAALGGAFRAIGPDINGLYGNPANMAATRVYHLGAFAQIWPEAARQSYGAAAVDSITSRVAGGIGGNYTAQDPDGLKRKATDVRLGLAFAVSDKVLLGASGKYLKLRQDGLGPLGQSLPSSGLPSDSIISGFTFDAGITVKPTSLISIGLLGANLTNTGNGFRPLQLGGGLGVGNQDFSLVGDFVADFSTFDKTRVRAMAGGELLAADHFPLRLGYRFDEGQKTHAISGGVGYLDQIFAVDVAVRRNVVGESGTAIIIGLQYFLESSGLTRSPGEQMELQ
jgi:hypothetical protein